MKCIRYYGADTTVIRVSDEVARKAVAGGHATYRPKSRWKLDGRKYV